MIPFASQRGSGQDLATHLMNAHDNETVEIAHLRGAVAQDLSGAFAEWEAQAAALTKCRNYLYSLSVNPDPSHGQLSRDQYLAYIGLAEEQLGLSGQPRAVVFHVKPDSEGRAREHCHVIWSRIDVRAGKARHLAYDHDKLMMATREFAAGHGIKLPPGYYKDEPGRQLSLYEKVQQDQTGLTQDERTTVVTGLWQRCDSAAAFVSALEEHGYILATGKRPYVLVDLYGHVNALPKLIDDKEVRTSDVREFLGKAYSPDSLPSVEEAQALAAQHRKAVEDFEKARAVSEKTAVLAKDQAERWDRLTGKIATFVLRRRVEWRRMLERQAEERKTLKAAYLAETRRIRIARAQALPKGLAAFLGRVSGIELVRKKVQRRRDRKRYEIYLAAKRYLQENQRRQRQELARRQKLQMTDVRRRMRALLWIQRRERQSLETALLKERRKRINGRHGHMPPVPQAPDRNASLTDELNEAAQAEPEGALTRVFQQAATDDRGENQSGEGGSAGRTEPTPDAGQTTRRRRERPRRPRRKGKKGTLSNAFERANQGEAGDRGNGGSDGEGASGAQHASEARQARRRRRERRRAAPDEDKPKHHRKRKRKPRNGDEEQDQKREAQIRPRRNPYPDRGQ